MKDCIFCKIVSGEIPSRKVFENEDVLAFDDIQPVAPAHVVIVPKKHFANIMAVDGKDSGVFKSLLAAVQEVARIKGIAEKGFRTVINTNQEGGQIIFHLHVHVFGGRQLKMELE